MKNLNKILIIPIILACSIFGVSLADTDNSDCGIFGILPYDNGFNIVNKNWEIDTHNFLTLDQQKSIITKNDLNTTILNLQKYCCEKNLGGLNEKTPSCIANKPFFNDNSLDSAYLFDHIFDVIMRRLNGLSGETNIYTKTNMTLDNKGVERRNFITKQATSTGGSNPQIITNEFKKFRTQSSPDLGYNISLHINTTFSQLSNEVFLTYISGSGDSKESEKIANAMKNYSGWTLYDRYSNACVLTEYFYALLNQGAESMDKIKTIYELSKNSCNEMVKKQIQGEANYVTLIEQRSSNKSQSNYIEGYISYMYERQQKLQNLLKDSKNRRLDVIRATPGLQRQCTK